MNVSAHFTGSSSLIEHDSPMNSRPDSSPHGGSAGGGASGGAGGGGQPYRFSGWSLPKHAPPARYSHGLHVPSWRSTLFDWHSAAPLSLWLSHLLLSALVRVAHCPMLAHGAGAAGGGASEIVNVAFMPPCFAQ